MRYVDPDPSVEWRPVPWNAGYLISSDGRALKCRTPGRGRPPGHMTLSPQCKPEGYIRYRIGGHDEFAHRLVYAAFVGVLQPGLFVCHLDGDPSNNAPCNLLQDTPKVNSSHRLLHGTDCRGQKSSLAKHDDATALRVLAAIRATRRTRSGKLEYGSVPRIAAECGASITLVYNLSSSKAKEWPHIRAAEDGRAGGLNRRTVGGGRRGSDTAGVDAVTVDRRVGR